VTARGFDLLRSMSTSGARHPTVIASAPSFGFSERRRSADGKMIVWLYTYPIHTGDGRYTYCPGCGHACCRVSP